MLIKSSCSAFMKHVREVQIRDKQNRTEQLQNQLGNQCA